MVRQTDDQGVSTMSTRLQTLQSSFAALVAAVAFASLMISSAASVVPVA
jgi:hypothetical protein